MLSPTHNASRTAQDECGSESCEMGAPQVQMERSQRQMSALSLVCRQITVAKVADGGDGAAGVVPKGGF